MITKLTPTYFYDKIEDIPFELLQHITKRITEEVSNVNRVLYDLTPKPSGTIEWE